MQCATNLFHGFRSLIDLVGKRKSISRAITIDTVTMKICLIIGIKDYINDHWFCIANRCQKRLFTNHSYTFTLRINLSDSICDFSMVVFILPTVLFTSFYFFPVHSSFFHKISA